ncbi:E3 ubiquitin-protein ligase TRIM4 [Tamandua tetradactyla]|uniref:E3 ubiquitin-protein ligase TRIM4 n=1 Tax=Tamandua tetradactyla TaxID=48850 RepID=UPI004053C984
MAGRHRGAPRREPTRAARPGGITKAEDLQEEVTCSICLDYFNDPVCTECSHNFCRGCLRLGWAQGGPFLCPECRQPSEPGALRPNLALARLTEKTRRLHLGPAPPDMHMCSRHGEPLRLFCEEDQRPVCVVCRESLEHREHTMEPLDEALRSYQEKLYDCHFKLMAKLKQAVDLMDLAEKNAAEWQEKIKDQERRFNAEFAKLHQFLAEEKHLCIQKLRREEEEMMMTLKENKSSLRQEISSLKKFILEVTKKRQSSTLELLQNPQDVLTRSENQKVYTVLETPMVKTVCQIPMMKEMLKRREVAITFAEETAHPQLSFTWGGRYAKNMVPARSWPLFFTVWGFLNKWRDPQKSTEFAERFQHLPCVLGKNIFKSGQHYWEVESQDSLEIAVGVCREDVMWLTEHSKMGPDVGIWGICWSSCGYWPLTSSPVSPTKQEPALRRVGVFLDHSVGEVSFYNAVDGTHLHTFYCHFVSHVRPFFWLSPLASLGIPLVVDRK